MLEWQFREFPTSVWQETSSRLVQLTNNCGISCLPTEVHSFFLLENDLIKIELFRLPHIVDIAKVSGFSQMY